MTATPQFTPTAIWPITQATVIAQDPDRQMLTVMLRDGQVPNEIPVLFPGACDALRANINPMPGKGTVGVVLFLNNDIKSGVWIGAYVPGLLDAIPNGPDSPFVQYQSHWSGFWEALDDSGNSTVTYPDGTSVVVGSAYTPYKHIRNASGQRERVVVTSSDRPTPASAMPIALTHSTGTTLNIDASGNITVHCVGTVTVTGATEIHATAPVVKIDNNGTTQFLVTETAWNYLTTHTHSGVTTGGGSTGAPNGVPTTGVLTSVLTAE